MDVDLREAAWLARCSGRGELSPFPAGELDRLLETVGSDDVEAGTPLMTEGKPVAFVGVIHRGVVELHHRAKVRRIVLQLLHGGDVFGDIPFLCGVPAPFGARALTDATITRLDPDTLWSVLGAHPHLCQRFLFSVASRLQRMQHRLLELTAGDLRSQLEREGAVRLGYRRIEVVSPELLRVGAHHG